ncbi:MAG TPA: helix-turn-helix domain-containing protein [Frankiaceae bacterium]|jgi:excisionase family DNA binding protein|nr:helix-turn-helix domain-containing protein [Frankiaceae bacterium]
MRRKPSVTGEELLTPHEVSSLLGVPATAVRGWADIGRLTVIATPGGHRRYRASEVLMFLAAMPLTGPEVDEPAF